MLKIVFSLLFLGSLIEVISAFNCTNSTAYCLSNNVCASCPTARPYCNLNLQQCTSTPDASAGICPEGMFSGAVPSLADCRSYVECLDGTGLVVQCPAGYSYDPSSESCQRGRACFRFLCTILTEGTNIAYPGNSRFYAFCSGRKAAIISACSQGKTYNKQTAQCEFSCPGIGNFPDLESTDCKGYWKCEYTVSGGLRATSQVCGNGQTFLPTSGKCEAGDNVTCSTGLS